MPRIFFRHFLFFLFLLDLSMKAGGQNLVPNADFENFLACPDNAGEVNKCVGWSSFGNSSDYFNSCDTSVVGVPLNNFGYQNASSGYGYCGLWCYSPSGYREYIGCSLISPLQVNTKYYVSFKCVQANIFPNCKVNKIGAKFSTIEYFDSLPPFQNNLSHIYSTAYISDTANWVQVYGSFISDSSYSYLILGNFFDNANTDTLNCGPNGSPVYIYIDDICVSVDSTLCSTISNIKEPSSSIRVKIYCEEPGVYIINSNSNFILNNLIITNLFGQTIKFTLEQTDNSSYKIKIMLKSVSFKIFHVIYNSNKIFSKLLN